MALLALSEKSQVSSSNSFKEVWSLVWQLKISPRDKVFLWRVSLEISLPTQSNLFKKNIVEQPLCLICRLEVEDIVHALWRCESAKDVWSACSKSLQECYLPQLSMLQLFEALTRTMKPQVVQESIVVAARHIWWRKNFVIFIEAFAHPSITIREAKNNLELLTEDNQRRDLRTSRACTAADTWQAPPLHWLKLNWDGAIYKVQGLIGVGVVARDSVGHIIATMRSSKYIFLDPLLAAYGVLQAVNLGLDLGFTHVILEGDSLQVIMALKNDKKRLV
ncbi:hypothetical protein F2P56_022529 [Juglans regia]|uniref:Uncharacterized protein n=2 Tax=Juglans regia TaxID=51240 RepID=A0A833TF85_JUGRE|nr:uncharacterized protein LOC109007965 [Juglans regia]KAF5458506.1 hypothetical protein F2P56_022529 [Juglans regia]